ncbi:MAG: hypothetical protein HY782_16915, partial [Chloroflexi bacterium]|nr:hypothetical protein [Chloroflexota bacterium]
LGFLVSVLPVVLLALIVKWLVSLLSHFLEGWQNLPLISILGQTQRVNMTQLLGLGPVLEALQNWDTVSALAVIGVVAALSLLGGVLMGAISGILELAYNLTARLTGGIQVELVGKREADSSANLANPR